ncbi:hypothetical protein [Pseudomonas sp. HLS-6 TE3448]
MTAIENITITITDTDIERTLKQSPFRDVCFRAFVFVVIASVATLTGIKHFDPLAYLDGVGRSVAPMLNIMGSIALILCIPALMTKDLEVALRNAQYRAMARGRLAGLSRRLASDLTLWSLGALIGLLTSLLIVMTKVQLRPDDYPPAAVTITWIVCLIIAMSMANIQIRLPRPTPLASLHPALVGLIYVGAFVFITYFGVVKAALV